MTNNLNFSPDLGSTPAHRETSAPKKQSIDTHFRFLTGCFAFYLCLVIWRILYLMTNAEAIALKETIGEAFEFTTLQINSERGNIYDRAGYLLAGNTISYIVSLNLQESNKDPQFVADYIAPILGMDHEKVRKAAAIPYEKGRFVEMPLVNYATKEQVDKIEYAKSAVKKRILTGFASKTSERRTLDSVVYYPNVHRYYPDDDLAANIIGFFPYMNPESGAAYGIEQQFDDILAAEVINQRFSLNPNVPERIPELPSGASIVLTIDRSIQRICEGHIEQAVKNNKAKSGTIIISDPKSGEVLAMAVYPRINLNEYWKSASVFDKNVKFNPAVMQPFETGSVFKVITMAAALDAGVILPTSTYNDTGKYPVMGVDIMNWDRGAWGQQNMIGCMQHSLNTCLSYISELLGAERFYRYIDDFRLNVPTGIELAQEDYYPVLKPGDAGWTPISLPTNSFGQGLMTNSMQLVQAVGALANGGVMMKPHIVKAIYYADHVTLTEPEEVSRPISPEAAAAITELLATSIEVEAGDAQVENIRIAGKTGTGEIAEPGIGYVLSVTNASFIGWGPADDPQFVAYVWLQEPTTNIWGSEVSAPLFGELIPDIAPYLHLPTDRKRACLYTDVCPTQEPYDYYYGW